jgi:hypothetical protein
MSTRFRRAMNTRDAVRAARQEVQVSDQVAVPSRAIDVLRDQIAPNASDEELVYLGQVGQRLGLDPIAGHLVLIERWDSRLGRKVSRPTVTAEGRLVLADRSGQLVGIDGPEWCGPRNDAGGHDWVDVWDCDDAPHAARVFVHRRGWERPVNGTVRWAEFAQTDRAGNLLPTWQSMSSHMLGKTALSLGLRRAFPGVVPADVEVDDIGPPPPSPEPVPVHVPSAPPIDEELRLAMLERAATLEEASPQSARHLRDEWKLLWKPQRAPNLRHDPLTRPEGELFRLLLLEAERTDYRRRPEPSPIAWAGPLADEMPDAVHDDDTTPEALGHDGGERYDPDDGAA